MVRIRIDDLLEARGKTAYWLAVNAGINHGVIYKLRHGKMKTLSLELIESLCRTLECGPSDLLSIENDKSESKKKSKSKS